MTLLLVVNGSEHRVESTPGQTLLSVLRTGLDLTGTKYGCGEGQCGACTVLVEGRPVRSCQISAVSVVGKRITTIEGLAMNGKLHPAQQAFLEEEAFQCGYCTPGMIMSAVALLEANPNPGEPETVRRLNGNICRCGAYERILRAVHRATELKRAKING